MNHTHCIENLRKLHALVRDKSYPEACEYAQLILESKQHYPKSIQEYVHGLVNKYSLDHVNAYHLSINPSYATEQEIAFWNDVHRHSLAPGAAGIKELRFRKFPEHTLQKDTIVQPARLSELFNVLHKKYRYSMNSLPSWVSADDIPLHVDWEHRRWQICKYDHNVEKGFIQLCWYIDSFISNNDCASVITSNKLDHPNRLGFLAAQRLCKPYYFVERSPFMGHLVEPRGMFGESKLNSFLALTSQSRKEATNSNDETAKKVLNKNIYGFRPQEKLSITNSTEDKPFLFFPLDNLIWTGWEPYGHPQGKIDYPNFSDISLLLGLLSSFCETNNLQLIVKPHPSCKEYPRLAKHFSSISFETDRDLASLINHASIIICGLTKVAFNAAALGKIVITVGNNPANLLPNVLQCVDQEDLIDKMNCELKFQHTFNETALNFMLERIRSYYQQTEANLITIASTPYRKETIYPFKVASSVYQPKVKTNKIDLIDRIRTSSINKQIPVLFDISRLINPSLRHSGISKFVQLVFREVSSISEIDIIPYINFLPLSRNGLPALELHSTLDALSINSAYCLGGAQLESIEDKFVYFSPHWALPAVGNQATRIITLHDVLHLTESFYEGTDVRKVTQNIIDSIQPNDRIVSVSEYSKTELQRIRPDLKNVYVVNLPPVLNRLVCGSRSEVRGSIRSLATKLRRAFILIPVQGDPRKRLDMMVDAGAAAVVKSKGLQCIFFGRAASRALVKAAIEGNGLNLGINCHFVEEPSDQELHYMYQNALTTLYLSNSEGYGLPPLEALAAGCLPITSLVTGLIDSMHGYSHGLEPSASLQEICNKIMELKSLAPTKYREEVVRNQRVMSHQLGMSLGVEYYNVLQDAWQGCEVG